MSTHKTFIGAYARNRHAGQVSDAASNRGSDVNDVTPVSPHPVPSNPGPSPMPQPSRPVPPHHFSPPVEPKTEMPVQPTEPSAGLPTDVFSHSVLVSNSYPEAAGLWAGEDRERFLRIDSPVQAEVEVQAEVAALHSEVDSDRSRQRSVEAGRAEGSRADGAVATSDFVPPVGAGLEAGHRSGGSFDSLSEGEVQPVGSESVAVPSGLEVTNQGVSALAEDVVSEGQRRSGAGGERCVGWAGADWEVDAFQLPPSVVDLFFDETLFRSIAEHMGRSVESGLRSVLVTSVGPREGRTTVTIGTAIAAAAAGIRVAIVDVDLEAPRTAERMRLDIQSDWVAAIRQGGELESVAVRSLEDGVTLIPLLDSSEDSVLASPQELDVLLDRVAGCFDLVLFDASPLDSWSAARIASFVDSTLIVRDIRTTSEAEVSLAAERLRALGVTGIGVVANFCS